MISEGMWIKFEQAHSRLRSAYLCLTKVILFTDMQHSHNYTDTSLGKNRPKFILTSLSKFLSFEVTVFTPGADSSETIITTGLSSCDIAIDNLIHEIETITKKKNIDK